VPNTFHQFPGAADTPLGRRTSWSARYRQEDPLTRPGVDPIVGLCDSIKGQRIADGYPQCSLARCGGELGRGLALGRERKVVATEQPDREVGEQHWPERELGAVAAGGIGSDNAIVGRDGRVEIRVLEKATSMMRSTPCGACARIASAGCG